MRRDTVDNSRQSGSQAFRQADLRSRTADPCFPAKDGEAVGVHV
jgi:hypothetical protein